ncbi:hypothetical protein, partial [Vibrio cholerae]|uniref:hypothetical protein n=1 Tax=Vibrio cholerae TaxID=666 RepID=UPI001C628218
ISREKPIIDINVYYGEHELTSIKVSDNHDIKLLKETIIVGKKHGKKRNKKKLPRGWIKHYKNFKTKKKIKKEIKKKNINKKKPQREHKIKKHRKNN